MFMNWVVSPIMRWAAYALGLISVVAVIYGKGRSDAKARIRQKQTEESNKRLGATLEADSTVRSDIARGGLLKDDGFKRD
jgi:hypothetical protein